jgi:glycosyltransferase involved in cell wall biosynthesis
MQRVEHIRRIASKSTAVAHRLTYWYAPAHRSMRVLYDISTLGLGHLYQQSRGGAFRVDLHMTEALAASSDCELLFCANHSSVAYYGCQEFLKHHPQLGGVPLVAPRRSDGRAWFRAGASMTHRAVRGLFGTNVLPAAVRRGAAYIDDRVHPPVTDAAAPVDILHSASTPLPARARQRSPQRFLTIYDLAHLRLTDLYEPAFQRSVLTVLRSLRPDDSVITTSCFVRDELCEQGVVAAERIHVVPLAAHPALFYPCKDPDAIETVRRRYCIPPGPYVLSVNSPDARKNVPHAIHAFAQAAHHGRDALGSLVLTGGAAPGLSDICDAIVKYPELHGRIILTGYVPDADLAPLYTGAQVFVYPSIYEGFGLPPLEAMQCGTPVITLNTSSLPEVVGHGGVMVPPGSIPALAESMLDIASNSQRRAELQQTALAQARRFSWEISTAATLRAYRAALN